MQIGRTVVTTKVRIKSRVPEFTTNGSHINAKNSAAQSKEYELEGGYKFDKNTKVVEINGKKYLVRPEIEEDQQDYDCKCFFIN